jgi:hypothetical protein
MDHPKLLLTRLDAALEATCETLIVLELIRARAADSELRGHAISGIKSLRSAIAKLRKLQPQQPSPLGHGFIAASDASPLDGNGLSAQPSP